MPVVTLPTEAKENFEKARTLLTQIDTVRKSGNAEELAKIPAMMAEAKALKDAAQQVIDLQALADDLEQFASPAAGGAAAPETKGRGGKNDQMAFVDYVEALIEERFSGKTDPRLEKLRFNDASESKAAGRASDSKTMSSSVGASGGYLIPDESLRKIMAVAALNSVVRARATIIRMSRRELDMPILNQTGDTAGVPSHYGGMDAFWEEEAAEAPNAEPTFRKAKLTAHKLLVYTEIPEELLADADTSLIDWLEGPMGFPGVIAWKEDYAFMRGTGAGQPQGVIGAPATLAVTRTTGSVIKYDDIANMIAVHHGANPVWVASKKVLATLLLMNGPSGNPAYVWGNATQGIPNTLLGYPIIFTDKQPAVGTSGDIMLCDFSYYLIGDRQATTIKMSKEFKFRNEITAMRASHRVDGQPWLSEPITLTGIDASTQISPFVKLTT